ncbi:putative heme-binding domain-containing protein [Spirosomataceae bacterium TFI 002]|nr:putative heme-binding domain-containing protein [Spirosomataceae bacterium TFI 002]
MKNRLFYLGIGLLALGLASYTSFKFSESAENPKISKLKVQAGFKAEHLFTPSDNDMGSWVSMCFDDKGRMITSDQYGGLYRLEIPAIGSPSSTPKVEKIEIKGENFTLGAAHGLLYAFNSLYVMVNNRPTDDLPKTSGFYRLQDTDGDDQYDKFTLLRELVGSGEHGPHSIKLSPDGKSLYVISGNYTDMPELDSYRLPKTWEYDNLFPEIKDPRGHANDRQQPGGWVANVDPEGKNWELISAGYRNPFDMAFNDIGDLFVYDADMEWDFGLPWYRPTRICHATSGSEFGWRTGDGKWLPSYPDNLPAIVNIGQGSPTNLLYLKDAKFPKKYKQSILAFDWSFGIMHALHLKPNGASYTATREEFLSGLPLPLTDGAIGPDGALYFLTGGRRIESDLYRVYYIGSEDTESSERTEITPENELRRKLEAYHNDNGQAGIPLALRMLDHPDRHVSYAARIVLEHQRPDAWSNAVLGSKSTHSRILGIIALARTAEPTMKNQLFQNLITIDYNSLSATQKLDFLRAVELVIARMGEPTDKGALIKYLDKQYPANDAEQNRSLSKILVKLEAPNAVKKTMDLLLSTKDLNQAGGETATNSADLILRNPRYGKDIAEMLAKVPPIEATYLAIVLSEAKTGWKKKDQVSYFNWFKNAFEYKGGNSYIGYINKARLKALENVPAKKKEYYDELSGGGMISQNGNNLEFDDYPKGPGKNWNMKSAMPLFEAELTGRDFKRGKAMYTATTCNRCHGMQGEGGNVGPDLTRLGTRFTTKDMLQAILDPNATISDQYAAEQIQLKNGESIVGRVVNEDDTNLNISQNPYAPDYIVTVKKADVVSRTYSTESSMLSGLVNSLNQEELKDLIAYLMAGGDETNKVFK